MESYPEEELMAAKVNIRRLVCTVRVRSDSNPNVGHRTPAPERPSLHFAMPMGDAPSQTGPTSAETATEGRNVDEDRPPAHPTAVDPKRVADRVYELLKEELYALRLRGHG